MEATIIFEDGTELTAEKNGESYIVAEKPDFPESLEGLRIVSEDGEQAFQFAVLVECASVDGRYWFTFIEEDPSERMIRELRAENAMLEDAIIELAELIGGE